MAGTESPRRRRARSGKRVGTLPQPIGRRNVPVVLPLLAALFAAGLGFAQEAPPKPPRPVAALGRIEPDGGQVEVAAPSLDRLDEFAPGLEEGKTVKAGDLLAVLFSRRIKTIEIETAKTQLSDAKRRLAAELAYGEAAVSEAKATVEQAVLTRAQELRSLEARLPFLQEASDQARKDFEAFRDSASVSPFQKDQQRLLARRSEEELRVVRDQIAKIQALVKADDALAAAKVKAAEAARDRLSAAGGLDALQQQIKAAEAQLILTEIRAPVAGTVLRIYGKAGEGVSPGQPVLRLGDLTRMAVVAEVDETDLWRTKLGDTAEITSAAFPLDAAGKPQKLTGKVVRLASTIGPNRVRSLNPAADGDLRVFEVRIVLDDGTIEAGGQKLSTQAFAARMLGLQTQVLIRSAP